LRIASVTSSGSQSSGGIVDFNVVFLIYTCYEGFVSYLPVAGTLPCSNLRPESTRLFPYLFSVDFLRFEQFFFVVPQP